MSWWSKLWAKPEPEPDLPVLAELAMVRKQLSDARCEWSQSGVISNRVLQQRLTASQETNRYLLELLQKSLKDTQSEIYKRLRFEEAHKND